MLIAKVDRRAIYLQKSSAFWDITACTPWKSTDVSEEYVASIYEEQAKQETSAACCLLHDTFLLDLFFDPVDGRDMFLRNVS
jgi:hypothetical protein